MFIIKCRHQVNVLFLTFLAYAAYHAARKPTSVVKNVLHRKNCSHLLPPISLNVSENDNTWCSWPPFGKNNLNFVFVVRITFLLANREQQC
jgi:OPA family glycerol-3-phosphate transporter-like MFS transporter 1/2